MDSNVGAINRFRGGTLGEVRLETLATNNEAEFDNGIPTQDGPALLRKVSVDSYIYDTAHSPQPIAMSQKCRVQPTISPQFLAVNRSSPAAPLHIITIMHVEAQLRHDSLLP